MTAAKVTDKRSVADIEEVFPQTPCESFLAAVDSYLMCKLEYGNRDHRTREAKELVDRLRREATPKRENA